MLIKLTTIDGVDIWINSDYISSLARYGPVTVVYVDRDPEPVYVKESADEIADYINNGVD